MRYMYRYVDTFMAKFCCRAMEMNLKCSICGKEEDSLLRANHRDLGFIRLCVKCWSKEQSKNMLLPLEGGGSCCR